ncbi:MAG TPA: lysophospholipid acyltransferase family protein, partial [Cellvibrionaceae bacterium]|nr:lysophospholipid acyltransferase family protein [Cellvibrionaceae bacterium]HMW72076.1 lysophospholipid acyltransferase family protein [Cellvibrionaceae bacterium]
PPSATQRVYFANHRSHGDFLTLWASLPPALRKTTRPVAGADYWLTSPLRRYIANRVFKSVLIPRSLSRTQPNPIELMSEALNAGDSLIIFPEGTRNLGDDLLPFKSGLFHLAQAFPQVEFVPVWIENLGRVMPKGAFIPVPLLCTLIFGEALRLAEGESRQDFLTRSRSALLNLAPLN